jgi:catechol 2,3-dioxygenase-like lactoylglutathione lyase family enzyme
MLLKHVALVCSSENNSDKFYKDLLGLEKKDTKVLPKTLSRQIFDLDAEYQIVNYANNTVHFEIFLANQGGAHKSGLAHICLEVDDLSEFLKRCRSMRTHTRQIPKGKGVITFITDFDGNLFEIKKRIRSLSGNQKK